MRSGTLYVYTKGHKYQIEDVAENLAEALLGDFKNFHAEEELLGKDNENVSGDIFICLPYGLVDAIEWRAA